MNKLDISLADLLNMLKNIESHFSTKKNQVLLVGAKGSSKKKNDSKNVNRKAKTKDNKSKTDMDNKGVCFHCNKPGHWKETARSILQSLTKEA